MNQKKQILIVILYLIIFRFMFLHLFFPLTENAFSQAAFSAFRLTCVLIFCIVLCTLSWRTLYHSYVSVSQNPLRDCRKTVICLFAMITVQLCGASLRTMIHSEAGLNAAFNVSLFQNDPFGTVFLTAVFMPVIEELVFRHSLYELLQRTLSQKTAVISVSVLFALLHTIPVSMGTCIVFCVYILCGIFLQTLYLHTSLLPCVLVHAVYNLLALLI